MSCGSPQAITYVLIDLQLLKHRDTIAAREDQQVHKHFYTHNLPDVTGVTLALKVRTCESIRNNKRKLN